MSEERRGRPSEKPTPIKEKWKMIVNQYPSKPELGYVTTCYFDINKSTTSPYAMKTTYPKGTKHNKFKPEKGKSYGKLPVVLVFKTSNRSNAKTKMKVFNNENIDYILSAPKLVGVPSNAIILECGVGRSFVEKWKVKYKL
tara:strand:- start:2772 stop:3194 length:423 start_codon:yes stop_codon:yes gene_type:complete